MRESFSKKTPNNPDALGKHGAHGIEAKYPRLVMREGKLLTEEEAKAFDAREAPTKKEPVDSSRRNFLKTSAAFVAGAAMPSEMWRGSGDEQSVSEEEGPPRSPPQEDPINEIERTAERGPKGMTGPEQLLAYGEIRDIGEALEEVYRRHYEYLTENPNGRRDLSIAVKNLSNLDFQRFTEPYRELDLSPELAYMVAIQESRGKDVVSHAGARGIMGIMPETARAFGIEEMDAHDPAKANTVTAKYLAAERDERFGDRIDMMLSAYNGGGGLFFFTASVPRSERTLENFQAYMQVYINELVTRVLEAGYYEHTLDKDDKNMTDVAKRFQVPLDELLAFNTMSKESIVRLGDMVRIPFTEMKHVIEVLLRKPFEVLYYPLEIQAKYHALHELGYAEALHMSTDRDAKLFG